MRTAPLAFVVLLMGWTSRSFAQTTPDVIIREFFTTYSEQDPEKAVDGLFKHSEWLGQKSDEVMQLKTQFVSMTQLVGKYYGYSSLGQKDLIGDLLVYDYLVKYARQPVRIRFTFYRADKEWSVYNFSFDDQVDEELKEAVKASYLHP